MFDREDFSRIMLVNPTITLQDFLRTTAMEDVTYDELPFVRALFDHLKRDQRYPPADTLKRRYEIKTHNLRYSTFLDHNVVGTGNGTRRQKRHAGAA